MLSFSGKIFKALFLILGISFIYTDINTYAQCSQNNFAVTDLYFLDEKGNPFEDEEEFAIGEVVKGRIYAIFSGTSTNAYFPLHFAYQEEISGNLSSTTSSYCVFNETSNTSNQIPKETRVFLFDYEIIWGSETYFKNIYLRWRQNEGQTECTTSASSGQCYASPEGLRVSTQFGPLPVEWHQFSVSPTENLRNIALNWSTLKEWESSHFEIERSEQGIDHFTKIAEVKSVGWSDTLTQYSYTDLQLPYKGGRLYYRIKQVDFDGSMDYSPTQMVQVPKVMSSKNHWQAIPNPVINKELQLMYTGPPLQNEVQVQIYTASSSYSYVFNNAGNSIDLSQILHKLPKGILIIEIITEATTERLKVIKK
ncbi:T9SS type A sorting domain-containing protein [Fontibacter flavus]|uniref:T9SS type A sorting domain-containing protein n=1 Tax=Fontibacter flavus TaxID=654838 RepID=A0ABV6FPZ0_9BACT